MEEHPFAGYIRALGKGPHGKRALSFDEARRAMQMILAGEVLPIQLGAFLTLMRVKIETPAEIAGLAQGARDAIGLPSHLGPQAAAAAAAVRLDWSAYAGKRRQLPWFVLSALLLASHGLPVLMHGTDGYQADRVFVPQALEALGLQPVTSLEGACTELGRCGFAFISLRHLQPMLHEFMGLKPIIGLRSPIHTVVRLLNPLQAPAMLQGVFHPGYHDVHQEATRLLGQPLACVVKGDGGEAERNPDNPCRVKWTVGEAQFDEEWPALFTTRHPKDEDMSVQRLAALWRGESEEEYGLAAVLGTAAIALKAMGEADSIEAAQAQATALWQRRPMDWLARAAARG